MPHPRNRRERFLVGKWKGDARARGETSSYRWTWCTEEQKKKLLERWGYLRRNTTKLCSCSSCGNPRRSRWNKDKRTMQEKRYCRPWQEDLSDIRPWAA